MRAGSRCSSALLRALVALLVACQRDRSHQRAPVPSASSASAATEEQQAEITAALAVLRREETSLRAHTDFAALPPSSRSLGANPYALAALPGTSRFLGILRGDSRLVLLDEHLAEVASAGTAPSPSALAVGLREQVFVAGPLARGVERFRVAAKGFEAEPALALPPAAAVRALAADERELFAVDFLGDRLLSWGLAKGRAVPADEPAFQSTATCQGPIRLALSPRYVAVACLFDHSVVVLARSGDGAPARVVARISHDGPIWSLALLELGDELFVAAGGVEDHPLVRKDRVFGYVDSYVFLYSLGADGALVRREATNVSELGVITPKALALEARAGIPVVFALGYGSDAAVDLALGRGATRLPSVPGCAGLSVANGRRLCANPLLDAWVELDPKPVFHPVRAPTPSDPSPLERLGEALFFTNLMAPDASSDGRLSRFTCETCHFEGGTDGRVHNSGRDEIRVSTRPLFGLFNDAPHFSRAHDRDLTSVCHNEFGVANRGNPVDPWFSLDPARFGWLAELGVRGAVLSPLDLRRALLGFLARFSHEENPYVAAHAGAARFGDAERRGAEAFRARCARCHEPRLVANEPASVVPYERWEALTFSSSTPIVWARGDYEKTGVVPYVDARGTRIPSLRRLYLKRPYLTNGSAPTLESVLERARASSTSFLHFDATGSSGAAPLGEPERADLLDFLRLL